MMQVANSFMSYVKSCRPKLDVASVRCAQTATYSPAEVIDVLNGELGERTGVRIAQAKGICAQGSFMPDPQAQAVTAGMLWHMSEVPVRARFSVNDGNPKARDERKSVRGMALHIGNGFDLLLFSDPVLVVSRPEEFVGYMEERRPNPITSEPDPARGKGCDEATPSTGAQIAFLAQARFPASYVQTAFRGVNAYVFTNDQGQHVYGRWRVEPETGRAGLNDTQLAEIEDDFLATELALRLAQTPARFGLWLQLAQEGDDVRNRSVAWSEQNQKVRMGSIDITGLDDSCSFTMFNPARLPPGIALSEDPDVQM